jgi:hypothetical protein
VLVVDDAVQVRGGENVLVPGVDPGDEVDGVRPEHVASF